MGEFDIDRAHLRACGGRRVLMRGHHPLVLDDPSRMWLLTAGTVTVMTSHVARGLPVGKRRRVFDTGPGTVLFPVSDGRAQESERLIVVSSGDATLAEVPLRNAPALLERMNLTLGPAIESWTGKLSHFAAREQHFSGADKFPSHGKFGLPDGMLVCVERGAVAWIQVEQGQLHAFGDPALRLGKLPFFMPVADAMWFQAAGDTKVQVRAMAGADDALDQVRGLALFNSLLQQRLRQFESEDLEAERQRLEEAERRESQAMQGALQRLSNVLDAQPTAPLFDDDLLSVATAVGDHLGISIRAPGRSEDPRQSVDPIEAIARASRVRHRQVLLAGRWWENDCGPLIAYRSADHRPLALLRHPWRGYSIFDPARGRRERLTPDLALKLEPKAVMLYPRLPETATSPWSIPRFAMRGRGADLLAMLGLALLVTLLGMLVPQATAVLMDSAIPDANRGLIGELGLAMAMAAMGAMMFTLTQGLIGVRIGMSTDGVSQAAVWDRLLSLRMRVFREYSTGDLFERAMSVSQVSRAINGQVMRSVLLATTSLMNLVLMYVYSPPLATGALLLGVVVMVVTFVAGFFARKYHRLLIALEGPFFGFVVELVNAVSKIRVASAQRRSFARWASRYAEQLELRLKAQAIEDGVSVFNNVVPLMSAVVMYWSGVNLLGAQDGTKVSVGLFLAFYAAMGIFLNGATTLSNMVLELMDTLVAANRVRPLLGAPVEAGEQLHDPGRLSGTVEFRNVHFRYSAATPPVLNGVNFKIMPEEFVAFVGPSGSGKSTLFRLLLGFEDVNEGAVLYDGQDLAGLNAVMVRRQLGVVMQTARINAGSIFENIAVGAPLSVADAWEAAEDAGFADDVRGMPMEMHTVVSEGGTNLSGGQRQRLMIARALARNPRVLLFDEATSALDNRTQAIVSSALERRKVTRLVIAHRLSTVRHADRIFVLSRGCIVESGTFDELVSGGGVFASMMARQIT